MNKHGIENFKFEVLIICFDDDIYEYEKEYIKKYNSQRPHGYNILAGGQYGGSRLGMKLSDETKEKVSNSLKEFYKNNPNNFEKYREKHAMAMKNSEKWNKALEEKRVGTHHNSARLLQSEDTKKKISNSVKKYFETNGTHINKEKHSILMTKINGRKVSQYSKEHVFIATFDSIKQASLLTDAKRSSIQAAAAGRIKLAGGYIWKYTNTELKED